MNYQGLYFGITMKRALTLYHKGLRYFRDTLDPCRKEFLKWEVTLRKFHNTKIYQDFWVKLLIF